jgi:hypothetical protein
VAKKRYLKRDIKRLPPGRADGLDRPRSASGRGGDGSFIQDRDAHDDAEMRGYKALWSAVLAQHISDAKSRSSKPEARFNRSLAINWLLENETDFNMVCDFAGRDPDITRRKILAAQDRDFAWNNRKPQLTKFERDEQRRAIRAELFDHGLLPKLEAPARAVRRRGNFATRGLQIGQMELTF